MRTDWPNSAQTAISLTFDVDAESGWLGEDDAYKHRLSTLSEARYGITRGLPRILQTLQRHDIKATFYVPGYTAELHTAWMNGTGMLVWENVFGTWVGWSPRDRSLLRAMLPVQRRFQAWFTPKSMTTSSRV